MRMIRALQAAALVSTIGACVVVSGQALPPGAGTPPAATGFDLSGYWTSPLHEDGLERGAGPELGDYGGFPINEAARLFALSYDASRVTLRHHQCDGYVAPYSVRSIGNARAWEERDPQTQRLIAIHWYNQTFEGHRTIWMDGRPHPPAYAPHSWMGFSTGRFVGNALEIQTTHLKQGWLRRNGLPESDQATMVEHFIRHDKYLTHVSVLKDPVYLTEPLVKTQTFVMAERDPGNWLWPCEYVEEVVGRPKGEVPNYLPGQNPFLKEFPARIGIPEETALGGADTMYPEYRVKLKSTTGAKK